MSRKKHQHRSTLCMTAWEGTGANLGCCSLISFYPNKKEQKERAAHLKLMTCKAPCFSLLPVFLGPGKSFAIFSLEDGHTGIHTQRAFPKTE
jgi:hypothetical protein